MKHDVAIGILFTTNVALGVISVAMAELSTDASETAMVTVAAGQFGLAFLWSPKGSR